MLGFLSQSWSIVQASGKYSFRLQVGRDYQIGMQKELGIRSPLSGIKPGMCGVHIGRTIGINPPGCKWTEAGSWVSRGSQGIRSPSMGSAV